MVGTDPHVAILLLLGGCTLVSLLASLFTWSTSRAKKVRLLEDQVVSAVRAQRARADQTETKLAEWQVTITAMLAEAEEFFERSVKERKRASVSATREMAAQQVAEPFGGMDRAGQIESLKAHFAGR